MINLVMINLIILIHLNFLFLYYQDQLLFQYYFHYFNSFDYFNFLIIH